MNLNIKLEAISHDAELKMLMLCRERTQYLPEGTRKRIDGAIRELLNTEFKAVPKVEDKEYNSENGNYTYNAGYAVTPKPKAKTETENILEHLGVQMTGTEICKAKHIFENRKREKLIERYIYALRKQEEGSKWRKL